MTRPSATKPSTLKTPKSTPLVTSPHAGTSGPPENARPGAGAPPASTRTPVKPVDVHCGPEEHARRLREQTVNDEQLERAAAIFRAAGDLSRLKLLHRLCDGEWCVTELAEAAGVGLSTVSQQLRLLRAERIVGRRRAGKHIFYSLADSHVSALIQSAIEHAAEPHLHHKEEKDDGD